MQDHLLGWWWWGHPTCHGGTSLPGAGKLVSGVFSQSGHLQIPVEGTIGSAREISEEPKWSDGARTAGLAATLSPCWGLASSSRSLGTPMRSPVATHALPGSWKPPGAFPATGRDGTPWSHWKQQENSLWVAEAHTSPPPLPCPPVPCFRKGQVHCGGIKDITRPAVMEQSRICPCGFGRARGFRLNPDLSLQALP